MTTLERRAVLESDIHLWRVPLDVLALESHANVLSEDELRRANTFATSELKNTFVRCRYALRSILAKYLDQDSSAITFSYTHYGKPFVAGSPVFFNVSHSHQIALIGVSKFAIGVDIECVSDRFSDKEDIMHLIAHPTELVRYTQLPEHERLKNFYQLWCQKEAYSKATGFGLNHSFQQISFKEISSGVSAVIDETSDQSSSFFTRLIYLNEQYCAAICSSGQTSLSIKPFHF